LISVMVLIFSAPSSSGDNPIISQCTCLSSIMSPITAILESCLNILFLRIVLYIHQK
jgi:hypothetical protein